MQNPPRALAITVRYDPYDLSSVQVWLGNEQYPDAQPLDLQRTRRREVSQSTPVPTTPSVSMSLLELAKRQYEEEKRQKLGEMRFLRLEEEKPQ